VSEIAVYFPWLHPELENQPLPHGVVFFDPGMAVATHAHRWKPEDLPLTDAEVRAYVQSYLEFAQRFPKSTDMQAYQAIGFHDFYTDTIMDIRSQLTGEPQHTKPTQDDLRRQAQLLLALALEREKQITGMDEQKTRFEDAQARFAQVLGLEDALGDADIVTKTIHSHLGSAWPWQDLLRSFLYLLPQDMPLFVTDQDVIEAFLALDIVFTPCTFAAHDELWCAQVAAPVLERIGAGRFESGRSLVLLARPFNL